MSDRTLTFGAVAEAYERFRFSYPPEVVEAVLAYAHAPISTALDIGAGTGKATRLFAGRALMLVRRAASALDRTAHARGQDERR